jgi:tetratricopeptide (TPR) repeat protein
MHTCFVSWELFSEIWGIFGKPWKTLIMLMIINHVMVGFYFFEWLMGDDYGAVVDLDNADKLHPNNIEILGKRGELKLSLQAYEGVMEDPDATHKLDPNDVIILQQRGYAKRMLKDYHSALIDLDKAIELEPDDAFTLCQRGCVKHSLHDYRGAT